jgi:protein-serine/threonine kinase
LQRETRFSEERARFYIAELILAFEHLHKYDIVYRYVAMDDVAPGRSSDIRHDI